jgi:hypothetical protein
MSLASSSGKILSYQEAKDQLIEERTRKRQKRAAEAAEDDEDDFEEVQKGTNQFAFTQSLNLVEFCRLNIKKSNQVFAKSIQL